MTDRVHLREVGLRDGLQMVQAFVPTDDKLAWIAAESAAGIADMEVTSLVPPKLIPQFSDAAQVLDGAMRHDGLTVSALIPNFKGAERGFALGVRELNYVLSVSEAHNRNNVRRSTRDSIEDFKRIVALRDAMPGARPRLIAGLATAFGCSLEGAVDEGRVVAVAAELAEAGADGLMVADTVGYGNPAAVRRVFRAVTAQARGLPVAAHFHDTRGLGLANVLAALDAGVRRFDASLGGLGGCPYAPGATGNIVLEDTAFMLEAMGLETGIDLDRLLEVRRLVQALLPGTPLHGGLFRAGLPKNFAGVGAA